MVDTDLGHLTHLPLVSLDLEMCLDLTSGCVMHLSLITSLCQLSLAQTFDEREACVKLIDELLPHVELQI